MNSEGYDAHYKMPNNKSEVIFHLYLFQIPLLRWKRSAVAAASCILAVRAVVVQLCFYQHMQV